MLSGRRSLGITLAVLTVVQWGYLPILLEELLADMDGDTMIGARFALAAALWFVLLAARRELPALGVLPARAWLLVLVCVLGLAANYWGFMHGLARTSPTHTQVLIQLAPALMAVGGVVFFGELFGGRQWLGACVVGVGLALFVVARSGDGSADVGHGAPTDLIGGTGLLVFAGVAWAVYALAQKALLRWWRPGGILLVVSAGCALCFAPIVELQPLADLRGARLGLMLAAAVFTVTSYATFSSSMLHIEASRLAAIIVTTPFWTLAFESLDAWLLRPERRAGLPGPLAILAAVVVVAGAWRVAGRDEVSSDTGPQGPAGDECRTPEPGA